MVSKKLKRLGLILGLCMTLMHGSSMTAFAYVDESATTETTTEAVKVEEELSVEKDKEKETETTETEEEKEQTGAFSEDGNLSLLDDVGANATKNLEYMTVQTKNGTVFYLVIDRSADTENVYFLNQVDAADLMAIMDDAEKQEYEASLQDEVVETPETPVEEEPVTEEPVEDEKPEVQTNNLALFGVLGVVAVVVIGGYAFMKKKAKKDGSDLEEDLEFYDDEEYENEDEQEPEFAEEEDVD